MKSLIIKYALPLLFMSFSAIALLAQPPRAYTMLHCDPQPPLNWPALLDIVHKGDAYEVPITIEFSPQWVNMILSDPGKRDSVRAWQLRGHEIAGHHHGIFHCFFDGYTNNTVQATMAQQPNFPYSTCDTNLSYVGPMQPFFDSLDVIAGDSMMWTWGSSDDFPEVDLYPGTRYRTNGGRDLINAFSNVSIATYGPYSVCEVGHAFVEHPQDIDSIKQAYFDTQFSSTFDVISINTHVYDHALDTNFLFRWFEFIADTARTLGTRSLTVRQIMRELNCDPLMEMTAIERPGLSIFPNPMLDEAYVDIENWAGGPGSLVFRDTNGRILRQIEGIRNGRNVIERGALCPGVYLLELRNKKGGLLASRKLLVLEL